LFHQHYKISIQKQISFISLYTKYDFYHSTLLKAKVLHLKPIPSPVIDLPWRPLIN